MASVFGKVLVTAIGTTAPFSAMSGDVMVMSLLSTGLPPGAASAASIVLASKPGASAASAGCAVMAPQPTSSASRPVCFRASRLVVIVWFLSWVLPSMGSGETLAASSHRPDLRSERNPQRPIGAMQPAVHSLAPFASHCAITFASASTNCACGGIGNGPQTPWPVSYTHL